MLGGDEILKPPSGTPRKKKSKNGKSNSRRFSDEQIKSLESLFKMENKLEPRKKLEMARQLGLHPRQVAIWFQNRRARWKSKQVEQDYTTLKADYDNLTRRFDSLNKEKHALLQQLRNLCSQLKQPKDLDSGSENGNSSGPMEPDEDDPTKPSPREDVNLADQLLSDEKASNFDLGSLFDQPWDFWS